MVSFLWFVLCIFCFWVLLTALQKWLLPKELTVVVREQCVCGMIVGVVYKEPTDKVSHITCSNCGVVLNIYYPQGLDDYDI